MRKIHDAAAVAAYIEKSRYRDALASLGVEIFLIEYEKGELVTAPFMEESYFQVVVRGWLNIYFIRDDGGRYSLSSGGADYILGDMDVFRPNTASIYTEAAEPLVCLTVPIEKNKQALLSNNRFLRLICNSLIVKMSAVTALDAAPCSLPDRVLSYMKYKCDGGVLKGLEREAFRLHCSARQLQRILNGFVLDGKAEKVGKGAYRLIP